MPTFFPPIIRDLPRYHPDDPPFLKRALSFYRNDPRGINTWILKDEYVTDAWPKVSYMQPPVDDWVKSLYLGAHYYTISDAEAAELTALGLYVIPDSTPPTSQTWAAVLEYYETWADVLAANPTWGHL